MKESRGLGRAAWVSETSLDMAVVASSRSVLLYRSSDGGCPSERSVLCWHVAYSNVSPIWEDIFQTDERRKCLISVKIRLMNIISQAHEEREQCIMPPDHLPLHLAMKNGR